MQRGSVDIGRKNLFDPFSIPLHLPPKERKRKRHLQRVLPSEPMHNSHGMAPTYFAPTTRNSQRVPNSLHRVGLEVHPNGKDVQRPTRYAYVACYESICHARVLCIVSLWSLVGIQRFFADVAWHCVPTLFRVLGRIDVFQRRIAPYRASYFPSYRTEMHARPRATTPSSHTMRKRRGEAIPPSMPHPPRRTWDTWIGCVRSSPGRTAPPWRVSTVSQLY